MKFKTILTAALLSASFSSFAANDQVLCPSADVINQAWKAIDTVTVDGPGKFLVWSLKTIQDTNYAWHIVTYAAAADLNAAFVDGQTVIKNVTTQKSKNATDMEDIYICGYASGPQEVSVAAVSIKSENQKFKIASFDFKALPFSH